MTKEEAIEAIKEAYGNSEYTDEIIEALEQEPCEDVVSKFISRQVSLLEERMSSATNEGRWVEEEKCQYAIENLELVDEYIKAHPPVTPKEKIGHWIRKVTETENDDLRITYECSECKVEQLFEENYCPNCGVKMIKTKESEEV